MVHRVIGYSIHIYVKEGKLAISFRLYGEFNILQDSLQVVKEVPQPVGPVWPDGHSVFYVSEPEEGIMGSPAESHLLLVLYEEVGNNKREWPTHSHAFNLFVELSCEMKYEAVRIWRRSSKRRLSRHMVSIIGTLVKRDTASKLSILS
jgi:hypothetical protein